MKYSSNMDNWVWRSDEQLVDWDNWMYGYPVILKDFVWYDSQRLGWNNQGPSVYYGEDGNVMSDITVICQRNGNLFFSDYRIIIFVYLSLLFFWIIIGLITSARCNYNFSTFLIADSILFLIQVSQILLFQKLSRSKKQLCANRIPKRLPSKRCTNRHTDRHFSICNNREYSRSLKWSY